MKRITRRAFLSEIGAASAIVVLGGFALACGDDDDVAATTSSRPTTSDAGDSGSSTTSPPATTSPPTTPASSTEPGRGPVTWERVNLGFVSAYVLVRGATAAIVDTGVQGSTGDIEAAINRVGLGWADVGHVVLTHLHGDHIGSLPAVMDAAAGAQAYAGEADLGSMQSPRPIRAVGDGDEVFGLQIVATPGHTAGHISVYDPQGSGVLVAGDALNGADGGVVAANPQFTADMGQADESVRKLAMLQYDTVLFGHGEPVLSGASALVAALAADL